MESPVVFSRTHHPSKSLPGSQAYRLLDHERFQTRILVITLADPLECHFEHTSLVEDDEAPFTAISWCWNDGSSRPDKEIIVDGCHLSVSANVYEILTDMCIARDELRIWMDAICINQKDISERNQQVGMMRKIYSRAEKTLVWLGKDDGTTESAMDTIERISKWREERLGIDYGVECGFYNEKTTDAIPEDIKWNSVARFFSAPWFTRFWIIQEVALSRHTHVVRGPYEMCWTYLLTAAHYIMHNATFQKVLLDRLGMAGLHNAVDIGRISSGSMSPFDFLLKSDRFKATDPKDRLFAMYGFLERDYTSPDDDVLRKAYLPDYQKELVDIYTGVTRALIEAFPDSRLDLLLHSQRLVPGPDCNTDAQNFPSWVPKYHFITDLRKGAYEKAESLGSLNETSLARSARIDPNTSPRILRVAGVIVDTISTTCDPLSPNMFHCSARPCRDMACCPWSPYPCEKHAAFLIHRIKKLWYSAIAANPMIPRAKLSTALRTILIGCADGECQEAKIEFRALVTKYWGNGPNAPTEQDGHNDALQGEDAQEGEEGFDLRNFWNHVVERHVNRRFFISETGKMGSAAFRARDGDKVCIVFGLMVPLVLRQKVDHWILVGDAYLTGVMMGEYIRSLEGSGKLEEHKVWFDIH